jgi:erythronate-4-phosphate dehydrogenase
MKIVADENLARVRELFGPLGDLHCLPGRSLTAAQVRDADVLLVRSVTPVNAALLAGSRVRFVGTATIGRDHLDMPWLEAAGITVASAPGCNAVSVVQYVLTALCHLWRQGRLDWERAVFGVVGLGNVGHALARTLQAMGMTVAGCDPLVRRDDVPQVTLDELTATATVICLHTPLTREGPAPTWHLFDHDRLAALSAGQVLLNAGRGEVVDNAALRALIDAGRLDPGRVVLDVWEGEPAIDAALLRRVAVGTPHIAGYSLEGKTRGSRMILQALCRHAGLATPPERAQETPRQDRRLVWQGRGWEALAGLALQAYPLLADDAALRDVVLGAAPADAAAGFDRLRKLYPERREFAAWPVTASAELTPTDRRRLSAMGFTLVADETPAPLG